MNFENQPNTQAGNQENNEFSEPDEQVIMEYIEEGKNSELVESAAEKDDDFRSKLAGMIHDSTTDSETSVGDRSLKWVDSQGSLMTDILTEQEMRKGNSDENDK